ncbi:hypothetical protein CP981_37045 [Streptomyces platensis]|uniref:Uncharacterized protein n=1 Tax=Streptomyces platensis TaxID=58346 RepID=A0AAE6NPN8_STRPT|nr:hypothetical protein CP981_37045 [Streptomyces platensis]
MVTVDFVSWEEGVVFLVATWLDIGRWETFSRSGVAGFCVAFEVCRVGSQRRALLSPRPGADTTS